MSNTRGIQETLTDKRLASLGDAYVNFVYSLALTQISGYPRAVKVSDKILAEAFKLSGLRKYLGSRVTKKDIANACESLLVQTYLGNLLTIDESVKVLIRNPSGPAIGLSELLKLAAERLGHT